MSQPSPGTAPPRLLALDLLLRPPPRRVTMHPADVLAIRSDASALWESRPVTTGDPETLYGVPVRESEFCPLGACLVEGANGNIRVVWFRTTPRLFKLAEAP